jgi:polysaccharide deacetylase family protein (PEP-CTERM system associated)
MLNALTFDVEDYFHVHAFASVIPRQAWPNMPTRIEESMRLVLGLLREHDTRATFFILGWVAERHPDLIRQIAGDGHELSSHGYAHELVYELNPDLFRRDVERSRDAIQSACPDARIDGYRAPSFSITQETTWAFEVLESLGFTYDSSIFPLTLHDRYGIRSAPRFAHIVGASLLEIPLSTIHALGCNWPVAGGGYFRLAPLSMTAWAIRRINRIGRPAVVYLHPWEFDPEQPRVPSAPLRSKFRHYVNLRHTQQRLRALLQQFSFGPIGQVFRRELWEACHHAKVSEAAEHTSDVR